MWHVIHKWAAAILGLFRPVEFSMSFHWPNICRLPVKHKSKSFLSEKESTCSVCMSFICLYAFIGLCKHLGVNYYANVTLMRGCTMIVMADCLFPWRDLRIFTLLLHLKLLKNMILFWRQEVSRWDVCFEVGFGRLKNSNVMLSGYNIEIQSSKSGC